MSDARIIAPHLRLADRALTDAKLLNIPSGTEEDTPDAGRRGPP